MSAMKPPKAGSARQKTDSPKVTEARPNALHFYVQVAGLAIALGIGLLLLMVFAAPLLSQWGLVGNLWFVLLIALGLCAGVVTFALFKSRAIYTGRVFGGEVVFGGPVVVMFAVVLLGFFLVPSPTVPFVVTVFLRAEGGSVSVQQLARQARLTLEIGTDRKTEPVGEKGESRFVGIPSNFRGRSVPASLQSELYELVNGSAVVTLAAEPTTLRIRAKQLPLTGYVFGDDSKPLANARISVAGASATSDQDGYFALPVPADLRESEKFAIISAVGFSSYKTSIAPGGGALQIRLSK